MQFEIGNDGVINYDDNQRQEVLAELYKKASANYKQNLKQIKKHNQLIHIPISYKDVIIVGAGPSLKKQLKYLKKLSLLKGPENQYFFVIMVIDAAYKFCVLNNVRMDYVITSENGDHTYFNIPHDGRSILLAYAGSGSAKHWKGQIFWHDYIYETKWKLNKTNKFPCYPTGFIILNTCLGICNIYGARAVILIGNDLCMKSRKKFYAYNWNDKDKNNTGFSNDQFIPINRGFFRKKLYTTKAFALAAAWLVSWYRKQSFHFTFVNCSYPSIVVGLPVGTLREIYLFMIGKYKTEAVLCKLRKFKRFFLE